MTILYGTNTANSTLPNACNMVTSSGASETSKLTTFTGSNTDAEIYSQGGTMATVSGVPSPSGHGWVYQPGAGTYAAANWSAIITLSSASIGRTVTVRFYKYSGGTYSSIGSIAFTNTPTAKTANSFTATSMPSTTFGSSDLLYIDAPWHDASSNAGGDNPTVYVGNSGSAGVVNDMQITTSTFTPAGTTVPRTIPGTAALIATLNRTVIATAALLSTNLRTIPGTAAFLSTNNQRTIPATAAIANTFSRTIPAIAALNQPVSRTIPGTAALIATVSRIIIATAALLRTSSRTIPATAALLSTNLRTIPGTAALTHTSSRTIIAGAALLSTNLRTIPATASLVRTVTRTIPAMAAFSSTNRRTIPATAALTIEIASGGFTLFGNGTGTVSYDSFRVTQFPDPALSLSPVLPRLGSSIVSWSDSLPTNTTLAVKTSIDGVNFTDVTSQNAGMIPGLNAQPAPSIDLFTIGSSANYTNTNKSGGSVATVTYDTTNSRMTLAGGSGGLYLYSGITDNDVDLFAVMDSSDAGGLVWRYVDASNYYELGAYDDSSSSGFTSQLRLYKVVAGTRSLIGSASSVVWPRSTPGTSPYKIIRVTMLGTAITVYFDGVVMQTATDSSFSSGKMGLRNDGGTSRYYQLRLQQVGDYVSGGPVGDIVTGEFVYTQVSMSTTDPGATPQLFDLSTSAYGPQIAQGALIPQLHDPSVPFAIFFKDEMDNLATLSGDFYWDIAQGGSMSFLPRTAVPAPWCLHSGDLLYAPQVKPTNGAEVYSNRQSITNCVNTIPANEQKIADGTATSWQMTYPLYSAPVISVQGVAKTVGVQGVDSGKDFYWQSGSNSIGQDAGATKLTPGFVLDFAYVGQSIITVTADNIPEQLARKVVEGGTGIVEAVEDGKGMLATNALVYAQGLLARHANNNTVEIVVVTQRAGLDIGMTVPTFIPEHLINNAQLLITKITASGQQQLDGSVLYEWLVTATSGPNLSNWLDALIS